MYLNHSFFKGEGHSRNGVFFEIANKKVTLSRVTDRASASDPTEIPLQRGPKFNTARRHFESYFAAWPLVRDVKSYN